MILNLKDFLLKMQKIYGEEIKDLLKDLRDSYKEKIDILKRTFSNFTKDKLYEEVEKTKEVSDVLIYLLEEYHKELNKLKIEKNLLNFSDLEHLTLEILKIEEARNEINNEIKYIFFDEYQDINPLQEKIINSFSKAEKFFVGDVKQSIYRFRNSEPKLFIKRYRSYSKNSSDNEKIDLKENFRSDEGVIYFINQIFHQIMSEDLGGIDYTKIENQLVYGREKKIQDNLSCQIILNENIKSNETDIINPNALSIARKIKELKKDGYDNKDIIILLRNIRGRVIDYKKALDLYDIPSFTDNIEITFNDPEVKIFLNLLKIISNYYNDLELISVLLTPIGNFTEDDLSKIKNSESGYMYEYMKEYSNNDEIKDKINLFFHKINYYREKLKEMSLIDFSNFIAEDSYYIQYIESSFQGDLKVENLYSLFLK